MTHYKFKKKNIETLSDIDLDNSNKLYYTYKGCDFYYKKVDTSDKLVVGFHGSVADRFEVPIFGYFDYNKNVLSIADSLLKEYRHTGLNCAWYLSSKTHSYKDIYIEILSYFIKPSLYNNIVFTGSSAGGFAAMHYGSYFKAKVIICNSQFYINKHSKYNELIKFTGFKEDDFVDFDIHSIIKVYGLPKQTIIYQNIRDISTFKRHYIPFKTIIEKEQLIDKIEFNEFYGADPIPIDKPHDHHHIRLPENTTLIDVMNRLHNT